MGKLTHPTPSLAKVGSGLPSPTPQPTPGPPNQAPAPKGEIKANAPQPPEHMELQIRGDRVHVGSACDRTVLPKGHKAGRAMPSTLANNTVCCSIGPAAPPHSTCVNCGRCTTPSGNVPNHCSKGKSKSVPGCAQPQPQLGPTNLCPTWPNLGPTWANTDPTYSICASICGRTLR